MNLFSIFWFNSISLSTCPEIFSLIPWNFPKVLHKTSFGQPGFTFGLLIEFKILLYGPQKFSLYTLTVPEIFQIRPFNSMNRHSVLRFSLSSSTCRGGCNFILLAVLDMLQICSFENLDAHGVNWFSIASLTVPWKFWLSSCFRSWNIVYASFGQCWCR